ncbi:MAG: hypothetical protein KJO26_05570 [Deltaproteobacteria bacterium]|nr:hypothetical protein [Deltaproteobacteria bacterium]MBT8358768.1 hypothetical protein [Deltaproteobacteria bacterium]NNK84893.1 hypothetical protein [Desulfobacterales bacterium]
MNRKLLAYIFINILVISYAGFFLMLYYNPEPFNDLAMTKIEPEKVITVADNEPRYTREQKLIAGSCAFLLVGCLFWLYYRKINKEYHDRIGKGLIKKEDMGLTSWKEWAIALLVCPGALIPPVLIAVFYGFSHFW